MAEVKLVNISKSYDQGKNWVIKDVNLNIPNGQFVAFVGPSGCGKSTLLRMVCGLEEISSGEMFIAGERVNDMPPNERRVGMVFQSYALYPHMSVIENMAFGLKLAKADKALVNERVQEAARILQLEALLDRKPKAMSGGQRQRVAIGRSIVQHPRVFLFDEPLSNLDVALRVQMRQELSRLHTRLKTTSIYVTHDQVEAMTLADQIVVLSPLQPGAKTNLEQVGKPLELYHYPANMFVAGFIGSPKMNFFDGFIEKIDKEETIVKLTTGEVLRANANTERAKAGDRVVLGIRPEDALAETDEGNAVEGKVEALERLGAESFIYMSHDTIREHFIVRVEDSRHRAEGTKMKIELPVQLCHLFDADGKAFRRTRAPEVD
ncbi:ABC transporter [Endozoicomonas montiporae]|uniref:ABC transporter n=2 Tax=Endozoicomonas montiporae TaxID=1027273 RepID=A0A081N8L1_9GAMM|nr:sn-glycerol-3-phosphate ABC transporter ATP-binding protein UgpC [Endozoicomonas montiporae]AMO55314.1 maltose/maltodextrin import ATP-binding protein MalK [Endozoicomonas montiporae CL-33]KEQ14784.1 ABC transporter [Endozoicomonas montiporae]